MTCNFKMTFSLTLVAKYFTVVSAVSRQMAWFSATWTLKACSRNRRIWHIGVGFCCDWFTLVCFLSAITASSGWDLKLHSWWVSFAVRQWTQQGWRILVLRHVRTAQEAHSGSSHWRVVLIVPGQYEPICSAALKHIWKLCNWSHLSITAC